MCRIFLLLFLYGCISGVSYGQITPTGDGDILTYDVFSAKQQLYQADITFEPDKSQRVLKLNIENNGDRTYAFMNEMPFAVYDKYFVMTSFRGKAVGRAERYELLPINQKIDLGVQWDFVREGHFSACGNWTITYHAVVKNGADTLVDMNGKKILVKTLLIEYRGDAKSDRCDAYKQERFVLYAPELDELLLDQWFDFTPEGRTSEFGYKWVLKSVTATASQVPKWVTDSGSPARRLAVREWVFEPSLRWTVRPPPGSTAGRTISCCSHLRC